MYIKWMVPDYGMRGILNGIGRFLFGENDEVHYIGGAEVLPPPLSAQEEREALARLEQYTLCDVPAAAAVPPRLREARFKHRLDPWVQAVKPVFVPKAQHALLPRRGHLRRKVRAQSDIAVRFLGAVTLKRLERNIHLVHCL